MIFLSDARDARMLCVCVCVCARAHVWFEEVII